MFTICPSVRGDLNCDCAVNTADLLAFVQALLDLVGYATSHPNCNILNADMQPDGVTNGADIQGFVDLLVP